MANEKVYQMSFGKIYPALLNKVLRKGRTQAELDQVITWLTGYTADEVAKAVGDEGLDYQTFFQQAPDFNQNARLITGVVCGIRVENIEEPLMQQIRYLDKLVDELAKGKAMEKILRS